MAEPEPDDNRPQPGTAAAEPAGRYLRPLYLLITRLTPSKGDYHGDAAARVFDIPELLEQILLRFGDNFYTPRKPSPESKDPIHFPIAELFVVQRVNRTFQNAIIGSIKLRRMMFLEIDPDPRMRTQTG